MTIPLRITFKDIEPSAALEARIRQRAEKLERWTDRITDCHVSVSAPHRKHNKGNLFLITVDVVVPGQDLVVNREHRHDHAHEDPYVAVRDAFDALTRRLEDAIAIHRGDVKHHEPRPAPATRETTPTREDSSEPS